MTTSGKSQDPDSTELLATQSSIGSAGSDDVLAPGTQLGRYRIEAFIGRGGMGEVYRARQLEPVQRTVALKLLRAKRMSARHLAHFEVERQLLARMQHPAIAQIYDAGTTEDGFPFFAMEYIQGQPLTLFCDERGVSLRERLELFIRTCEAVQHAHHKGVIHRDLKPGNILVDEIDGRAMPKVIDFGIATATSLTEGREAAGTPDYMSPEQAGGDQALVDTRSDVYSLGVVLYELLTGHRPERAGETVDSDASTLRLPSACLSTLSPDEAARVARGRGVALKDMRQVLRQELDWVVAKAMCNDRDGRYLSAAALAEDLQRYLDNRPMLAVPSSRRYAWGKFMRRHRTGLLAAGLVLLALLGGLGMSLYGLMEARTQRSIAEQRSAQLEKIAAFQQSMLEDVDIEAMGLGIAAGLRRQIADKSPQDTTTLERLLAQASTPDIARRLIDRNILEASETAIARDFSGEPGLAANLRESIARVREALGMPEAALAGYRQVADYREQALGAGARATLKARQAQIGALLLVSEPEKALALAKRTLSQAGALPGDDPLVIKLQVNKAGAVSALGDRDRALELLTDLYQRSVETRGERDPASMRVATNLGILLARMGERKQALDYLEGVVENRTEVLGPEDPLTLSSLHNLAVLRIMTGDGEGALVLQRRLLDIRTRQLGAEHPSTLKNRLNLANMLADTGQLDAAIPLQKETLEIAQRVLGAMHPLTVQAKLNLSTFYARAGQFDLAIPLQDEVARTRSRLLGPQHPKTIFIRLNQVATLQQSGRPKAVLEVLQELLPVARKALGEQHPQTQLGFDARGKAAAELGDLSLAAASFRELLAARQATLGDSDESTVEVAWQLAGILREQGNNSEADALRARYIAPLLDADQQTLSPKQSGLLDEIRTHKHWQVGLETEPDAATQ